LSHTLESVALCLLLGLTCAWAQKPSDADSAALIERSRQKALDYTRLLPDFMCTQVVRRATAAADGRRYGGWTNLDTLTVTLRYSHQKEEHTLVLINGKPTDKKYDQLAGGTSSGEFGGVLRMIFNPSSQASLEWESWKTVRKHRVAVYQYAVSAAHSPYYLGYQGHTAVVGIHGVLEIESETGEVLHFTYISYDIPQELGVQTAMTTVDYDFADVGGRNYLLPSRSETEIHAISLWARNHMEFHDYKKFGAESLIDFGTGK
jgi:hypothetical protein